MKDNEHAPEHADLQKKHKLKEHEVVEVVNFLKRYGKLISAGVLAAAVTVIASSSYAHHKASRLTQAEQLLMSAQTPQELEAIVNQYGSTPSASVALLNLAKTFFNDGDAAQARVQYDRFLKKYGQSDMRPMAEIGLAYCTEADGDFNGAAEQFASFTQKHPENYLHPQAILSVARCMEQAGRIDEARVVLEDFLAEKGDSTWAGLAESTLEQLTK